MDRQGSTTPTLPPPESSQTAQPTSQPDLPDSSPQRRLQRPEQAQPENAEIQSHKTAIDSNNLRPKRPLKTPEPQMAGSGANGHGVAANEQSPYTPGNLAEFDWDDLEERFDKALADANAHEQQLLTEFEELVKYFNVWTSAASAHDNERASKRLQTRVQYVKIQERSVEEKKKHFSEVMKAFQSAMVLLSQP